VLISPYALGKIEKEEREISVDLTKKRIENSPPLSSETPVSRQFEDSYYSYYGWPMYWGGPKQLGPIFLSRARQLEMGRIRQRRDAWDPHLRAPTTVDGITSRGWSGEIGHVEDIHCRWTRAGQFDYLVINTNWGPEEGCWLHPNG